MTISPEFPALLWNLAAVAAAYRNSLLNIVQNAPNARNSDKNIGFPESGRSRQ